MPCKDAPRCVGLLVAMICCWAGYCPAQTQTAQTRPTETYAPPKVYLATMEPGDESYERFGHDAIVVGDPNGSTTAAFNFGVFDFDAPNFIGNFILGRMQYWLD